VRLYSEEWVAAFNEAVAGLEPVPDVSFRMLQVVHGGPDGTVRVALDVNQGRVRLVREPGDEPAPQVTVSVQFDDAIALALGQLDPARLLAAGRVRVRGDLSVLVSGQALLASAAARLEPLSERTTS
jgi:ubiquinone biosynthesis protein UbiJ